MYDKLIHMVRTVYEYGNTDKKISATKYTMSNDIITVLNYEYDESGNCIYIEDTKSHLRDIHMKYDNKGRVIEESSSLYTITNEYDNADRIISTNFNGVVTKYEYDCNNNVYCEINQDGSKHYHGNKYDENNRLISFIKTDYDNSMTVFNIEYDTVGNKIKETRTSSMFIIVIKYDYDEHNKCTGMIEYMLRRGRIDMAKL
jgi:YD repeat-containing protein